LGVQSIYIEGDTSVLDNKRLAHLGSTVKGQGLDMGVAIEMDADHCLFATGEGEPVFGDKSFAVIAKSILSKNKGKVVMPINSTTLMEDVVRENGGLVIHCTVGEQTVVRKVKENMAVLGGDLFGCLVIPGQTITSDALLGMVKMFEIVVKNGPLAQLVEGFPSYYISRGSMDCPEEKIHVVLEKFKAAHDGEEMDLVDGVKIFRDKGWMLVRESNVRGVIKLYAQADSQESADKWIEDTLEFLNNCITA
jgi:phosphomannomutase/phosphoglucomutase